MQLACFLDRDIFVAHIDHEHRVGQVFHVLDAAEGLFELVAFAGQLQDFLLQQARKTAVLFHLFNLAQALDGLADGAEICQHAAKPAVGDIGHATTRGFLGDRFGSGALGADKDD